MNVAFIVFTLISIGALWWVVSTWRLVWSHRRLRGSFVALCLIGIVLGLWLALRFEYHAKRTMRVAGFPFPAAFFVLEGDRWTDFVLPFPTQIAAITGNVLVATGIFLLPLRTWRKK
jgi:hypothetical protein